MSGDGQGPCPMRSKLNKFEHVWGLMDPCTVNMCRDPPKQKRLTDMIENITFPQLPWWPVIITLVFKVRKFGDLAHWKLLHWNV